jgi:hypothetical protein
MKASARFLRMPLLAGILFSSIVMAMADLGRPVITAITPTRTSLLVEVSVPAGIRQVVLEGRSRLGAGSWEPRAVVRTDGQGGAITISVAFASNVEILRVKAGATTPLPASFYAGTNTFNGPPDTTNQTPVNGGVMTFAGSGAGIDIGTPTPTDAGSQTRDVVESDIWKISGNTLYYFNQNRGLQIVDITNPDQAAIRATYPLPAVGEQMYLVNTGHVALLARQTCTYPYDSKVVIVNVAGATPRKAAELTIQGTIQESRMVGNVLYVSSSVYRAVPGPTNSTWEYGTAVASFDLADPALPVNRDTLWFSGYSDDVVAATDTYLFVCTRDMVDYWRSVVHVIDITSDVGRMSEYAAIHPTGWVPDKFKLNYAGGVLTTIAEDWRAIGTNRVTTHLETFRLPDPRSAGPVGASKLGELILGGNEQLHATRFDGERVYVVTFFRIDPLWVVDLSDPTRPHIAGELQVPGWSSYIQPLGDRLVAVGVDSSRVAVSLFDVRDPAHPGLYNKVLLGNSYSWSEANNDEKAFTVLPDAGLILVPYSGDTTNGWASQVQLIDLNPTNLVARGLINHQFQPRRATLAGNRVLSLSGWELLTVNAADRDLPVVTKVTDLAWPVDRVFLAGDYLLELTEGQYYYWGMNQAGPVLRVAPANDPNQVLTELDLTSTWPVVGSIKKDDRLYVIQTVVNSLPLIIYTADGSYPAPTPTSPNFLLTIFDLSALPHVSVLGHASAAIPDLGYGQSWELVWPSSGLLVWVNLQSMPYFYRTGPIIFGGPMGGFAPYPYPMYWQGGGQMLAFNVANPATPALVSTVNLSSNSWFSFSKPYASDGLVFISHGGTCIPWIMPMTDPMDPTVPTAQYYLRWERRSFLDVVDFTDPINPVVRKPVNIPGTLTGIAHGGDIVYTTGQHYDAAGRTDYTQWLDASAYDGVSAYLVDSLRLPQSYPPPIVVAETNILVSQTGIQSGTNPPLSAVAWWAFGDAGKFVSLGKTTVPGYTDTMASVPPFLVLKNNDNLIQLFDLSSGSLTPVGNSQPSACLWPNVIKADADAARGLWIPMNSYGVLQVPVSSP